MPTTMPKIFEQIGVSEEDLGYNNAGKFGVISKTVTVKKGEALFPRIDVEKEIEALNSLIVVPSDEPKIEVTPVLPEITIDEFAKVDMRVALVKECEPVKKSDKLLCLQLDDGMGGRQVVSGISQWYKPSDLIGKKVIIIANLKPVKLRGVMSEGMICASELPDGSAKVIFPDDSIPVGSKIR